MSTTHWNWFGRAWVFGDDVSNDDGLMPLSVVRQQMYDPAVLAEHCFQQIDPSFSTRVQAQDFVIGGQNFAHGNPHIQGFLGLKGLGVGLLVESMGRGPLRACVNAGVPVMLVPGITSFCASGDQLSVNFETGLIRNDTRNNTMHAQALAAVMREIIAAGGGIPHMVQRLNDFRA